MDTLDQILSPSKMMMTATAEYEGVWFPPVIRPHHLDKLKTFEVREDDLILATYPKSGTHWMYEVLLLMHVDGHVENIKRDTDPAKLGGLSFAIPPDFKRCTSEAIAASPSPRMYGTHLPHQLLPPQVWTKKPKMVYLTRNPKDACSSMYRFANSMEGITDRVSLDVIFKNFFSEKALFGNWFDHTLGYWQHRNKDHLLFVTYEEMKQDLRSVVERLEGFLGLTITPGGMERILEHASLQGMKKTYAKIEEEIENGKLYTRAFGQRPFIQKGVSGSWQEEFTEEQTKYCDQLLKEKLTGTGLDEYYH